MLIAAGSTSFVMMVDDQFLLHEELAPTWLGIPESVVLSSYVLLVLWLTLYFRAEICPYRPWVFALAGVWFATSIAADLVGVSTYVVEDVAKIFGIATWAFYWVTLTRNSLRDTPHGDTSNG